MYGKLFASMYSGSMFGKPAVVFATLGYAISNMRPSKKDGECYVEINPVLLAATFATTTEAIDMALSDLESPDPASRSIAHEGRRLVLIGDRTHGPRQYLVVNGARYRAIRDEEARRLSNREAKRRERSRTRPNVSSVSPGQPQSSQEEAHVEVEVEVVEEEENGTRTAKAPGESDRWESDAAFSEFWADLCAKPIPKPVHKRAAMKAFAARVTDAMTFERAKLALAKYRKSARVARGFVQDASTWLNDWEQWEHTSDIAIDTRGLACEEWLNLHPGRPYGHLNYCDCEECATYRAGRGETIAKEGQPREGR